MTGLCATLAYTVNALGQIGQVVASADTAPAVTLASNIGYYPNGALKQFTYGNGIVHGMSQNARLLPSHSTDGGVLDLAATYDQNGNVTALTDDTGSGRQTRSMGYDGLDRLAGASSPMFGNASYTYSAADNLSSVAVAGRNHTYVYNSLNQLTNVLDATTGNSVIGLSYDVQGNLSNKNGVAYSFDFGNRLRTTAGQTSFYDGLGRRVRQDTAGAQLKYSFYAQDGRLVWQRNEGTAQRINNVYLNGGLIAEYMRPVGVSTPTITYLHTDPLGSPIARTNSAGTVIETSEYEPYGKLLNRANDDKAGYTGHVMDSASGLTYMQERYFWPEGGIFLSVDPVTAYSNPVGAFNRYRYANNNPYKFTDPDGRIPSHLEKPNESCDALCWEDRRRASQERISQAKRDEAKARHGQRTQPTNIGFKAKGLLAGKPAVTATGTAAFGGGIQATKGIYNSDSSIGVITPALGLTASVDVNLISVSYTGRDAKQAPVEMKAGFNLEGHALLGGRISAGYTPPSTFEFSVDAGAGLGAAFHVFEVNAVIDED